MSDPLKIEAKFRLGNIQDGDGNIEPQTYGIGPHKLADVSKEGYTVCKTHAH